MRSRNFTILCLGFLISSCSSGKYFEGPDEHLAFKIITRFESSIPGFDGSLSQPISCDIDENGLIYILDQTREQIVVLSPELEVIRLIGGSGDDSDVRLLPIENNPNQIRAGGGIIAHADMIRAIQVFSADGTLITTFETEHQARDLSVSSEGHIFTSTMDPTYPVVIYDRKGNVLDRYGPAFIQASREEFERDIHLRRKNYSHLTIMPDHTIILFNPYWLRFRVFDDRREYSDRQLDLLKLIRSEEEDIGELLSEHKVLYMEWSPERINSLLRRGEWRSENWGGMVPWRIALDMVSDGDDLWLFSGQRLIQCDDRGRVRRLIDTDLEGYWGIAIHEGMIVLCSQSDGSLAIGRLPPH